jgi:hypothetical protein
MWLGSQPSSTTSSRNSLTSDDYEVETRKRVRGEIQRYHRKIKTEWNECRPAVLENVVGSFVDRNRAIEFTPTVRKPSL